MFRFVEYSDSSILKIYLAQELDMDLIQVLQSPILPVQKEILENWSDFSELFRRGGDLFGQEKYEILMIDIGNLKLDLKVTDELKKLADSDPNKNLIFYNSWDNALNSEEKKAWQKSGLEYKVLKKDPKIMQNIALEYAKKLDLDIENTSLLKLAGQAQNYAQIMDNLDFIDLAGDGKKALDLLLVEEKMPIFMYGFDPAKTQVQAKKWYTEIGTDDLQLGLSLIFGKLDKNGTPAAQNLAKKLILTDLKIKSAGKVEPLTWFRLFLWESANGV
jgi:hypothetical protein